MLILKFQLKFSPKVIKVVIISVQMIDTKLLIDKTVDFMLASNISENEMLVSARRISSPFAKICEQLIGKYCFKTTSNFISRWKRDQRGNPCLIFIKNI